LRVVVEHELVLLRELLALIGKLRSIGILRLVVSGYSLTQSSPHGDVVGKVGSQSPVKIGVAGLQVCCQTTILHGQVVIFFLVHLFVNNILLSDTERPASATLVDLAGSSGTLDTGLKASVATTGGSDVCSVIVSD